MDKALADLIKISNITGKDSSLVQGGGGNTSVKTDDGKYMYIKASGTALKDMNAERGWRRLRLDSVLSIIKDRSLAQLDTTSRESQIVNRLLLACDDEITFPSRPSVEAHLHAFLDKYVIHLHPVVVGAYVNAKQGKEKLLKLFKNESPPPLWVDYADPGFMLAKKIANAIKHYQKRFGTKPAIIFLQKHGLCISADSADKALSMVRKVIDRCEKGLKLKTKSLKLKAKNLKPKTKTDEIINAQLCIRKAFFQATGKYTLITYFCDDNIASFYNRSDAAKLLAAGALSPDELVYANGPAMWIEPGDIEQNNWDKISQRLSILKRKTGKVPKAFLVADAGLFVAAEEPTASVIRDIVVSSFFTRIQAADLGGIAALNKKQSQFINQWEAETFRASMLEGQHKSSTATSSMTLAGRIALVTGAGSGLGRSIAIGLAKAGAAVAIVDIDTKAADETRYLILDACGMKKKKQKTNKERAIAIKCDVTKEADVKKTYQRLLSTFGGLDILVNCAGIAPAYSLIDFPLEKWQAAIQLNLTGYFLMAKEAAKFLIRQGMGGVIINISSKTGLEASKDNTAYNATKAGELAMARGWALELGKFAIRVNCVAPGNVFEGSKIWNRQYIKACAKKYGIKPEEVIPYYISKTALAREIKGADIADCVVFLCSDNARNITGQTLVVDAGQVMVR